MSDAISLSTPNSPELGGTGQPKPANAAQAAQQFEGMLIAEMLKSAHDSTKGGILDDDDSEGDTMRDFATQQFSQLLAANGGLGLSKLILQGLNQNGSQSST